MMVLIHATLDGTVAGVWIASDTGPVSAYADGYTADMAVRGRTLVDQYLRRSSGWELLVARLTGRAPYLDQWASMAVDLPESTPVATVLRHVAERHGG